MATVSMVEYDDAPPEVRAVYDDIMETRKTDWINNFWKVLANHRRLWSGPGRASRRSWRPVPSILSPRRWSMSR